MLRTHARLFEHLTLAADLVLIAGCWLLAYVLRFHVVGPFPGDAAPLPVRRHLLLLLPILVVWTLAFGWFDLYRPRRLGSRLSEWRDIAKASTAAVLVMMAVEAFVAPDTRYSRLVIVLFWALAIVGLSAWRSTFRAALRLARRRGHNLRQALLVGGGEPADAIVAALGQRPDVGVRVMGRVGDAPTRSAVHRLGGYDDLRAVLDRQPVDLVLVALPRGDHGRLAGILSDVGDDPVAIHVVPDIYGLPPLRGGVEAFEGVPLLHLRESPLLGWNRVLKRLFDVGIGAIVLGALAPLMALIALAIRCTSRGPVIVRQERMGLDGARFAMLKFRTMQEDAEDATGPAWTQPGDPRRTRLGAVLRRLSLDELPQLVNVLRGDMSLVGPRPERPHFVEQFRQRIPGYMLRHTVKAGMTGWAQVNGWRGDTSLEKRLEYDLDYIERWSLGFDVAILLRTLWRGFADRNAY
jgi:Undecaprenyl-phosphate glucose phosphotransferase